MTSLATNPILIVDDEQTIRFGFSVALQSAGFEVEMAASGSEALDRIGDFSPDCIVLDLRMPDMDGLATASELRESGYSGPIVLASAYADHATAVAAIGIGITDFLTKPVKPTQLRYAVNHALSRHVRFSQAAYSSISEIPPGLLRAYAKFCLLQRRRHEAKAALLAHIAVSEDLQSLLLLGAIHELDQDMEHARGLFVRAAELHARCISLATTSELFQVFSHTDHPAIVD